MQQNIRRSCKPILFKIKFTLLTFDNDEYVLQKKKKPANFN